MEIIHYPHPALAWKSKPVTRIDAELRRTVDRMFELMYEQKGIGLAANQVALPLRLFIVNPTGDSAEKDQEFVFVNPEITSRKGSVEAEEGCLSLPDVFGPVRRADKIVVDAFDLDGQGFEMDLDDLPSRVVQHEHDHIDGVMFVDRMSETARREIAGPLSDFEAVFRRRQEAGEVPSDAEIERTLRSLEPS